MFSRLDDSRNMEVSEESQEQLSEQVLKINIFFLLPPFLLSSFYLILKLCSSNANRLAENFWKIWSVNFVIFCLNSFHLSVGAAVS